MPCELHLYMVMTHDMHLLKIERKFLADFRLPVQNSCGTMGFKISDRNKRYWRKG
jgi:hypothetical protein